MHLSPLSSSFNHFSHIFMFIFTSHSHLSPSSILQQTMVMATETHQFHVLAVDDSVIDRKLIERLLKTSSYHVTAVDSGSKALEFLGLNTTSVSHDTHDHHQVVEVNMIITDYCMPEMTGYDLLRRIKESESFKDIPVVIMSSENVPSRINMCLQEGAEEFFLKPVRLSDVNKLKSHLVKGRGKENKSDSSNNKRKDSEEIQSHEQRTRARYNNNVAAEILS